MDPATAFITQFHGLSDLAIDGPAEDAELLAYLDQLLATLNQALRRAVPAYAGMTLTLSIDEHPVSLTSVEPGLAGTDIVASLNLSLTWVSSVAAGAIIFYATAPDAFVDLTADLASALPGAELRLDEDRPSRLVPQLTGLNELLTVLRAVGILLDHGHTPAGAQRRLRHLAVAHHASVLEAATVVTTDPASLRWDEHGS